MISSISLSRKAVLGIFFINGFLLSSWIPHIPLLQERLGLSEGLLGAALFGMAIGAIISMLTCGVLSNRFGSKNVTIFSTFAFCFSLPLPIIAPSFLTFVIALFIFGASNGAMDVAMNAQAVAIEKRYSRPIMSAFHGFFSIGGLLGVTVGGIALASGVRPSVHVVTVSVLMLPAIIFSIRNLIPGQADTMPQKESKTTKPNGRLLGLGALAFLVLVAEGSVADWSSVYIKQALQTGPGFVAAGYASFSLMMAIGRLSGDRFVANIGPVVLTRTASLIAAFGLGIALLAPHSFTIIFGFGCVGLGLSNIIPVLFSSAGRIPGISSSKGIAAVATAGYFGFLAGPPLIGCIAELSTLNLALSMVVFAILIVTVFAYLTDHPGNNETVHPEELEGHRSSSCICILYKSHVED